jgi:HTH-type transcriptional regulator/antitoxin MqsA
MGCPSCDAPGLVRDTRDPPYAYNGETTTIPDVTDAFCSACGEVVLDVAESARVSAAMLESTRRSTHRSSIS